MSTTREHAIAQEAGAWLFRLRDDRSEQSRAEFSIWLQTSPQHVTEFLLASAMDLELGALDTGKPVDVDALLAEAAPNVLPLKGSPGKKVKGTYRARWGVGIAAGLGLMAALPFMTQDDAYRTDVGEQRTIKLADGSLIQLNTRSRIEVEFSRGARVIRLLEGEALFDVEHDPARPFEVRSGSARVQAIGTQFNVYRRAGGAMVSVVEGRVKVLSEAPLLLDAGQEAAIESDGRVVKSAKPEVARAVAWRQRHLEFHTATVAEVAAEFNRYNRVQIQIADEALASRSMSGIFNADEPQSLLDFLVNEGGVRFDRKNDEVVLYATSP